MPESSPRSTQPDTSTFASACALSNHLDTRTAATEVAHELHDALGESPDLVFTFGSFHHTAGLASGGEIIRNALDPAVFLAATAESVLAGETELEGRAGLSAIALRLPGVRLHPFRIEPKEKISASDKEAMRRRIGYSDDVRAVIILADPFSAPMGQLLPIIGGCAENGAAIPIAGGLASGASQPGHNVLVQNDWSDRHGVIGLTIAGAVDVDIVVSQGCKPIGEPLIVTKSQNNVIHELGGRPPLQVVQETARDLSLQDRQLLTKGLLVGVVINEYKERFGRGDFLIRNAMGFDEKSGALAVADVVPVGRTVQFHVRDAETATEDLQLLLDAQELTDPPFAALLFTCNGRGTRLFDEPNHDVSILRKRLNDVPVAGFFAAGEIGPIGDRSFVHGHTASMAIFRERKSE